VDWARRSKTLDRKAYGAAGHKYSELGLRYREIRKKAETIAATLDMFVADVDGAAPVADRIKAGSLSEEIEDMGSSGGIEPKRDCLLNVPAFEEFVARKRNDTAVSAKPVPPAPAVEDYSVESAEQSISSLTGPAPVLPGAEEVTS
jgi:hypothetical protein